jgi:hypothetical protein
MHLSFKNIKFYFTLRCSTCFGHHCVHHQELPSTAHAASDSSAVGRGRAGRPDHDQQHCYHHVPTVNQRLLLQMLSS